MEGGYLDFGSAVQEGYTFDDCIAVKTVKSYYLVLKFRDSFIKVRIPKKKYNEIIEKDKDD